ncbi:MAG: outer membrane beta-barrel protein [Treponema sp.]|nr:outer membrane beta-barrel protein [Treponema sp.]
MKKRIVFTFAILLTFAGSAWADGALSGLEVGGGARFELALGDMKEHESGNLGFNVNAAWPLPLGFPEEGILSNVVLSAEAGVLFPVGKKDYIESWWELDFALGAYVDLRISKTITLRPGISADIRLNNVVSEENDVSGSFVDFGGRLGLNAVFNVSKNLLVKAGADYTILPEKDNVCHYIGLNLGAGYRFN